MVEWWVFALLATGAILLFSAFTLAVVRIMTKREPYKNFMQLRLRRKLTFIKLLLRDPRVPWYVKAIPFFLGIYLISPIDIIPDFIPVVGYLDDVLITLLAFFLIFKLTSEHVVRDLLLEAHGADAVAYSRHGKLTGDSLLAFDLAVLRSPAAPAGPAKDSGIWIAWPTAPSIPAKRPNFVHRSSRYRFVSPIEKRGPSHLWPPDCAQITDTGSF